MKLTIDSFPDGAEIPAEFAFGAPDPENHVTFAGNRNPRLSWTAQPAGTRSFAVVCHDADVPTVGDDVNQEGKTVPIDLPRTNFFHWVLVDIPAETRVIPAGSVSDGVTMRGKTAGLGTFGRSGLNDYTGWFAGDDDMEGKYGGYDGPGPPWNDERLHHYYFTLYALDVERLSVDGSFDGPAALRAMEGHILGQSEWVGSYAIYEGARKG